MRLSSLLGHTCELLEVINKSEKPADSLIDTYFKSHKYLGSHDRRFIAETTYGVLRYFRKCEYHLASALSEMYKSLSDKNKISLLIVVYFSFEEKNPEAVREILSNQLTGNESGKTAELISSYLKKPADLPADPAAERIGIKYSFPQWMVEKFIEQYGESEAEKLCASLNQQAALTMRVNTLKTTVEECRKELKNNGIDSDRTPISRIGLHLRKRLNVFSLPEFKNGYFELQDEGSQLLPIYIDPKPNAKVLDVCAGAGGKTLEFSALMKNRGEIFAADINSYRLENLRKRAKRAGAQNVRIIEIKSVEELTEKYKDFFDIVFVDAPCSGLGTIRRNPGMKWKVTQQDVNEISEKQKSILMSSADLVKPDGILAYATCTLLKQENEDVVEDFLSKQSDFTMFNIKTDNTRIQDYETRFKDSYVRLFPHIHNTDGFFCAVLKKKRLIDSPSN